MSRVPANSFGDFRCIHCKREVHTNRSVSGVHNRNHCPYCLYSRHLDQAEAGDRDSECLGAMAPIALTAKRTRKKYGDNLGELMLVHSCEQCGKFSINRIAADDVAHEIVRVYRQSLALPLHFRDALALNEITVLTEAEAEIVAQRLYGRGAVTDLAAWLGGEDLPDPSEALEQ